MAGRLSGKRALVTGAGRGIGQAMARAFLDEGAVVLINDIDASLLADSVNALGAPTDRLVSVIGDVANPSDVQRMVAQAGRSFS